MKQPYLPSPTWNVIPGMAILVGEFTKRNNMATRCTRAANKQLSKPSNTVRQSFGALPPT
eukprot:10796978-Karenia_brevis.AAC.1